MDKSNSIQNTLNPRAVNLKLAKFNQIALSN